jgi:tyrosyl-tRNA synthetase
MEHTDSSNPEVDTIKPLAEEITVEHKYNLITRRLQEVIGEEYVLKAIISKRPLKLYWGTAPTGRIHIGYFVPLIKIVDYLKAGCEVIILLADLHAYLDNMKSGEKQLDARTEYYKIMIQTVLESLGVKTNRLRFVRGTDFQLSKNYTMDSYRLANLLSLHDAKKGGAEVVKQSDNPKMAGLIYPGLQALDEQYLGVDAQAGGVDRRKIFLLANKYLPKLGYKKRLHFMNPMVPSISKTETVISNENQNDGDNKNNQTNSVSVDCSTCNQNMELIPMCTTCKQKLDNNVNKINKMSASDNDSKIDLLDTKKQVKKKVGSAYCLTGNVDDNSVLTLAEFIVFPLIDLVDGAFVIDRPEKYGGQMVYENIDQVKDDFKNEILHPSDLKMGVTDTLNKFLEPIRQKFESKDMKQLLKKAYP